MSSTTIDISDLAALNGGYNASCIDGNTVGNTTVFTNNDTRDFYINEVVCVLTNVSGLTILPTVNVGTTPADYLELVNGYQFTQLDVVGKFEKPTLVTGARKIAFGESIVLRVVTGATATAYSFTCIIRGFYL